MTRIFYDLETTGLSPLKNSIHQIAGIIDIDGMAIEEFNIHTRPHPKAQIEEAALKTSGVTEEQILAYQPMGEAYKEFLGILSRYIDPFKKTTKAWLVGYNNRRFDDIFLEAWVRQNGGNLMSWTWTDSHDVLCMASMELMAKRASMPSFQLQRVAKTYGFKVEDDKLHDALYDINIARDIYYHILGVDNTL